MSDFERAIMSPILPENSDFEPNLLNSLKLSLILGQFSPKFFFICTFQFYPGRYLDKSPNDNFSQDLGQNRAKLGQNRSK
jgi:hypothetical protein